MGSVRVLLDPIAAPQGEKRPSVVRGLLRLTAEGPRKTRVTKDFQPATLTFTLGLITQLRETLQRSEQPWVTLTGELKLQTADAQPVFKLASNPVTLDDDKLSHAEQTEGGEPRQFLFVDFDATVFGKREPLKLPLPELKPDVRHLEVQVELKIAGETESNIKSNDVLDKPLARQLLEVTPTLCLDTPVDDPSEHNLAFLARIENDPFEVESLLLNGEALTKGENLFQANGEVYFRPAAKPEGKLRGRLLTTDGRLFEFELTVAQNLRERFVSLAAQIQHGSAMAAAAAAIAANNGADAQQSEALRARLLSDVLERKARLLDSIESTLGSEDEFAAFFGRAATLPPVFEDEPEDESA